MVATPPGLPPECPQAHWHSFVHWHVRMRAAASRSGTAEPHGAPPGHISCHPTIGVRPLRLQNRHVKGRLERRINRKDSNSTSAASLAGASLIHTHKVPLNQLTLEKSGWPGQSAVFSVLPSVLPFQCAALTCESLVPSRWLKCRRQGDGSALARNEPLRPRAHVQLTQYDTGPNPESPAPVSLRHRIKNIPRAHLDV
uniref:Uncharacterized protein n=1 Tax=Sphaerodactylus townsendi TaxID=933632 RepID=A0ACB8FTI7_9SAUR